jgi:hypothetical protein
MFSDQKARYLDELKGFASNLSQKLANAYVDNGMKLPLKLLVIGQPHVRNTPFIAEPVDKQKPWKERYETIKGTMQARCFRIHSYTDGRGRNCTYVSALLGVVFGCRPNID